MSENSPVPKQSSNPGSMWERELFEKILMESLKEQRVKRRWGIFFKLSMLGIFFAILMQSFCTEYFADKSSGNHTALVEINSPISSEGSGSSENVIPALERAFKDNLSVGVILKINTPGGSPVQAGMIYDAILSLRKQFPEKPIDVVVGEMCTSAGYYIASAANNIYVNKASIVGSIGVLMNGFGFEGLLEKLGIERRLLTSGENKGFLDPFSPMTIKQRDYAHQILKDIHQQFIDAVKAGRGGRLKVTPDTFSGLFWLGEKAVDMGLADGYGTVNSISIWKFKTKKIVDFTKSEGLENRLLKKLGLAVGAAIAGVFMENSNFIIR